MKDNYPLVYGKASKKYLFALFVPALVVTVLLSWFAFSYAESATMAAVSSLIGALTASFATVEIDLRSVSKKLGISRSEVFMAKFGLSWSYKRIDELQERFQDQFYTALREKEKELGVSR